MIIILMIIVITLHKVEHEALTHRRRGDRGEGGRRPSPTQSGCRAIASLMFMIGSDGHDDLIKVMMVKTIKDSLN